MSFFLFSVWGEYGEVLDVWCSSIENTSNCQNCIFVGKRTVNVMSNQGTWFWIIQSRCESEVWRDIRDSVLYISTCLIR